MDDNRWWDILSVGCPHDVDYDEWYETLHATLVKLPPDDILAFDVWFDDRTNEAHSNILWAAASLLNGGAGDSFIKGGASDDEFYYFCCWLVGMGKRVFEAALRDPNSLADVTEPDMIYEAEIYSVASGAWCEATGRSDDDYYAIRETMAGKAKREVVDESWVNSAEELRRRMPRLWVRIGD